MRGSHDYGSRSSPVRQRSPTGGGGILRPKIPNALFANTLRSLFSVLIATNTFMASRFLHAFCLGDDNEHTRYALRAVIEATRQQIPTSDAQCADTADLFCSEAP